MQKLLKKVVIRHKLKNFFDPSIKTIYSGLYRQQQKRKTALEGSKQKKL